MANASLGRGLDALLSRKKASTSAPTYMASPAADEHIVELPVHVIKTNDFQPRSEFNEEQLLELANSIREYGVIQPLVVTKDGDAYSLIAGERRLRASKLIGLEKVPVVIREAQDQERLAVALIENVQRVDLNPIELGYAYKRLIDEFSMSHDDIGRHVGKSRPVISNTIRLLNLPAMIQDALREGKIQMGTARAILGITDPGEQLEFFYKILEGKVSTRDAENKTSILRGGPARRTSRVDVGLLAREETLREILGTKVVIERSGAGGKINIFFYSPEELTELLDKLSGI